MGEGNRKYRVGDGAFIAEQGLSNQGSFASDASASKSSSTSRVSVLPGGVDSGGFFFPPAMADGGKTKLPPMKVESPVKVNPEVDDSEYL